MSEINQEKRDQKYNVWARRNPAIVSIVFPLLIAVYLFQKYTTELSNVRYIVGVVLSFGSIIPALLFFYQSSIRELSVLFVEKPLFLIFGRPAVNLMQKSDNTISEKRKERILEKANAAGIYAIYTDSNDCKDKKKNKKIVREAFESIREYCRENPVVFEFNCTYGFFRNLSGGLIFDLFLCGFLAILNSRKQLDIETILSVSVVVLVVLLLFCLVCTYCSAARYAKRVYVIYDITQRNQENK